MEYMILDRMLPAALVMSVNKAIAEGWVPQGGVTVYDNVFYQAMVRDVEPQPNKSVKPLSATMVQ